MPHAVLPSGGKGPVRHERAWRTQLNTLSALFFREAEMRQGRSFALGYLASAIEPLIIIATIGLLFSALGRTPPYGASLMLFLATGVFPIYLFIHTSMRLRQALAPGAHRWRYPVEQPLDHIVVHALLHIISSAMIAILFFAAMYHAGISAAMPWNSMIAIEALGTIFMFGVAMGVVNSVVARLFPLWDVIWPAFARASLHFSGPYFVAAYLPPHTRQWFGYNPIIHGVNQFRQAFYFFYPKQISDLSYLFNSALVLLALGLLLEAGTRRYLEDKE